jgi:predicted transcriptional regulator
MTVADETRRDAFDDAKKHEDDTGRQIMAVLESRGEYGCTDQELAKIMHRLKDTVAARRCRLRDEGFVRESGERRPTDSGKTAAVWVAVEIVECQQGTLFGETP